jgi:hypothetical protein
MPIWVRCCCHFTPHDEVDYDSAEVPVVAGADRILHDRASRSNTIVGGSTLSYIVDRGSVGAPGLAVPANAVHPSCWKRE